jgi:hypothetical protein
MGWLSDFFGGGKSSSSSSSSSNDGPSPAPTPTVIKTGTTLKTGTVLNNDDDPVVFTPKDDGGYIGQNQSTLTAATTDDDKSFGEVFSENRAAGEDTFVYKGEVYTTDLASDTPATPSVSYDAFGNAYDTPAAAAQADQVAEAQAAAAQNAITASSNAALDPRGDQIQSPTSNGAGIASLGEDDVMSQTVVGTAGQDYADSLPDFSYDFTADDTPSVTSGGRDLDADLGIGGSEATVTAADLLNDDIASDNITTYGTPGGGGVTLSDDNARAIDQIISGERTASDLQGANISFGGDVSPAKYYDAFGNEFSTPDAAAESDRAADAAVAMLSPVQPAASFDGNIYGAGSPFRAELQQRAENYTPSAPIDTVFPLGRSTQASPTGGLFASGMAKGTSLVGAATESLGEFLNPTTARVGYGPGEVDYKLAEAAGATPGASAIKTGAESGGIAQAGLDLMRTGERLQERIEGGLPRATQEDLANPIIGTEVNRFGRPGLTFDPGALYAKAVQSAPATLAGLAGFAAGPVGAMVTGGGMTAGEVGYEAGREVQNEALSRGYTPDEADAMRIESQKVGSALGLPAGAVSNVLFGKIVPGSGKSLIGQTGKNMLEEGFSEGYVEQNIAALASDPLLGQNTAGTRFSPDEAIVGALSGGVATPVISTALQPAASPDTFTPPAATTGKIAQTPPGVSTAYQEAAESMAEAGVSNVGDTAAETDGFPDKLTAAEAIMTQQLEDEGAIDVADLRDMGLTLFEVNEAAERAITNKMDSDNTMLQALADQSVLDTGAIDQALVEEINEKLGPEAGSQVVDNAFNRPFVSNEGKTLMDIMLENDAAQAGAASVESKAASGIETALGSDPTTDPATDPTTDPATDPTTDPATDPTTDPATDPTTDPATDPTTDPATDPTVNVAVDTVVGDEDEDEEVEVEVEEEVEPGGDVTVDIDEEDPFVPVITTTDENGETITECPEGYVMVEGPDGPVCQKSVTSSRQRAGASTRAYTGLAGNIGRTGPGQRRRSTTTTERVRPTVRSA